MRVLFDTHLLLWTAGVSGRLPLAVRDIANDRRNELIFSVASLWEVAIKHSRRREDFQVDPEELRLQLAEHGYTELPVLAPHAVAVAALPWIHKDPFDRLLVAQAIVEEVELLTVDAQLELYPGPIRCF